MFSAEHLRNARLLPPFHDYDESPATTDLSSALGRLAIEKPAAEVEMWAKRASERAAAEAPIFDTAQAAAGRGGNVRGLLDESSASAGGKVVQGPQLTPIKLVTTPRPRALQLRREELASDFDQFGLDSGHARLHLRRYKRQWRLAIRRLKHEVEQKEQFAETRYKDGVVAGANGVLDVVSHIPALCADACDAIAAAVEGRAGPQDLEAKLRRFQCELETTRTTVQRRVEGRRGA
ncbi:hypothetical protein JCM10213_002745 [Rhodosporidiobolus nylandii]